MDTNLIIQTNTIELMNTSVKATFFMVSENTSSGVAKKNFLKTHPQENNNTLTAMWGPHAKFY